MANAGILGQTNGLSNTGERSTFNSGGNFRFFSDDARTTLYIDKDKLVISEMPAGVYSLGIHEQTFSETEANFTVYLKSKFALSTNPYSDSTEFVSINVVSYAYTPGSYSPYYPYERAHLSKDGNMVATICGLREAATGQPRVGLMCLFKVDGVWNLANSFFTEIQGFRKDSVLMSGLTVSTDGNFLAVSNRLFKVGATTLTEIELPPTIDEGIVAVSVDAKIIATKRIDPTTNVETISLYQLQNQSYTLFQRIRSIEYGGGAFGAFSKSGEFFYMNGKVYRKGKNNTYIAFLRFDNTIDSTMYYKLNGHRASISDTGSVLWFLGSCVLQCDPAKGSFGLPGAYDYRPLSVSSTVLTTGIDSYIYHTPTTPGEIVYKVPDDVKIATVKVINQSYPVYIYKSGTTGSKAPKLPDNSCVVLSSGDCIYTYIEHVDMCVVTGIEHV